MVFMCQHIQNGTEVHHHEPNRGFSFRCRLLSLRTPSIKSCLELKKPGLFDCCSTPLTVFTKPPLQCRNR